ncbi:hypothetical protein P9305_14315 [Lysinibacillus capsici]|uniref:hypothetical protein n=1 Tax=Lysinibacillus capsici TaxID=2115968 RepID=UPI002E233BC9|nr:hypothetical protein [Lysinibacillus capsici]
MFSKDLARMYAYLPIKLSQLAKVNPEATLEIIQDWGDGRKDIRKLWETTINALEDAGTASDRVSDLNVGGRGLPEE